MLPLLAALLPGPLESLRSSVGDPLFFWVISPLVKILVMMFILVLPLVTAMIIIALNIKLLVDFATGASGGG